MFKNDLPKKYRIGELLLKAEKINEPDLVEALNKQHKVKQKIGEILHESYSISSENINEVLYFQKDAQLSGISLLKGKIGEVLKDLNLINENQIELTLSLQKENQKFFGEILSENKIIKEALLNEIIAATNGSEINKDKLKNKKLGELLVELNFLEIEKLNEALSIQKKKKKAIGKILIEKGYLAFDKLKKALTIQKKLASLTFITLCSTTILASCSAPKVPVQSITGIVPIYDSNVMKVLNVSDSGKVNFYSDGTVSITDIPFYQQGADNTCGQAVMTMILNYWGKNISYQQVVNQTNPGNLPTDISDITDFLKKFNLKVQDYRQGNINFLKDRVMKGKPPIVLLDFGGLSREHYVLVRGFNDKTKNFIIADPVEGAHIKVPYYKFYQMWQNSSLRKLGVFGDKYDRLVISIN